MEVRPAKRETNAAKLLQDWQFLRGEVCTRFHEIESKHPDGMRLVALLVFCYKLGNKRRVHSYLNPGCLELESEKQDILSISAHFLKNA